MDKKKLIQNNTCLQSISIINHLINNGMEIRKKGEWKWYMENGGELRCSDCMGYASWSPDYGWRYSHYCPDCGADMRGE